MPEKPNYEELELKVSELEKKLEKFTVHKDNEKYHILFEQSQDANLIIENEKFTACNQAAIEMFGYKNKTALIKVHPSKLSPVHQPDGQDSFAKTERMMELTLEKGSNRFEWYHKKANGEIFPAEVLLTTISHKEGNRSIHVVLHDITARKQIEKDRQKEKETLSIILESTPHGITLIDNQDKYLYVNPYFTEITGYTIKDIPTKEEWFNKAYPDKNYRRKVLKAWSNDRGYRDLEKNHEFKIRSKDGQLKHIEFRTAFLKDQKISVLTDITKSKKIWEELKESKQKLKSLNLILEHEATHDPLTGAPNRRAIMDKLDSELSRAKRMGSGLSIGLCDIDHFKRVNDMYGHQAGDDVLCCFVKTVKSILRPYDLVGRYGGEEFLLIVPESVESVKEVIYERIRSKIANEKILTRSGKLEITISIGIADADFSKNDTADSILAAADLALYKAKNSGRNQLAFAD